MVADAYTDALRILAAHRAELDRLRERLLEQRVLERVDILAAIGPLATPVPRALRPAPRPAPAPVPRGLPLAAAEEAA